MESYKADNETNKDVFEKNNDITANDKLSRIWKYIFYKISIQHIFLNNDNLDEYSALVEYSQIR